MAGEDRAHPLRDRAAAAVAVEHASRLQQSQHPLRKKTGGRSPKLKGYNFENECRHAALNMGLSARRVPLSGAGEEKGDLCITSSFGKVYRCELKRRKNLPEWIVKALGDHDAMIMRGDRGKALAVIPLDTLLGLLQ
jgi:hypothetical protein